VALAMVAICARLIPVRRAVRVDPVIALRHE
jgi:ABC-type antimicrobial peptide transport system permease subunit